MLNSSFIWQLLTLKTGLVAVVGAATTTIYSALVRFFGTDATTHDSTVIVAVVGATSALLVLVVGKAWETWTERRKAKTDDAKKQFTDSQESQVRWSELQLQERIDLRNRNDKLHETAIKIFEGQIEILRASAVMDHDRLIKQEEEIESLLSLVEQLKRERDK